MYLLYIYMYTGRVGTFSNQSFPVPVTAEASSMMTCPPNCWKEPTRSAPPEPPGIWIFHHAGTVERLRIFREAEVWSISSVSEDAPKKWSKSGDKKNWGASIQKYSDI